MFQLSLLMPLVTSRRVNEGVSCYLSQQ